MKKILLKLISLSLFGTMVVCNFFISTVFGQEQYPYTKKFIITAYYSPLPDQSHYFRGDYEAEIKLNGRGTHGASGRPVYPGMIAAPKEYPFGTKMKIPGVGVVGVYDRGGAIKKADGYNRPYDRLDIWMGSGEDGLKRALAWGVRVIEVEVYGLTDTEEKVNLSDLDMSDISRYSAASVSTKTFRADVYYKSSGSEVRRLQELLDKLGYLKHNVSGYYGEQTRDAVIRFQLDHGIIQDENDFGSGHFGINSRKVIDKVLEGTFKKEILNDNSVLIKKDEVSGDRFFRPLSENEKSDYVRGLQVELKNLGFLRIEPTGYLGETTTHAIFKFQQSVGLIEEKTDIAAGYFGPQTRSEFNKIINNRETTRKLMVKKSEVPKKLVKLDSGV